MSIKSKGRRIGRMIRTITGSPFPICMKIGKMVAQGVYEADISNKFPDVFTSTRFECGDGCCSGPRYSIAGPRGSICADYLLGESAIEKEYIRTVALRKVPLGTAVDSKGRIVGMENVPDTLRSSAPKGM